MPHSGVLDLGTLTAAPDRFGERNEGDTVTENDADLEQIVLVGAPGAGKSTVGAIVAQRLGWEFRDVDALIAERAGKSIAEIFVDDGEPAFRAYEEATTAELLIEPGVLALGGGAVLSAKTRSALAGRRVVWLRVGLSAAVKRVGIDTARPLLLGNVRSRLLALLNERAALYAAVATETVDTDDRAPDQIADLIVQRDG